jgi:uncharacterized membrane protein YvbJ
MEQKTVQDVIQIFCPICSKGILVRNESMYKCKKCGKEVCSMCFDRQARLCVECVAEAKKEGVNPEYRPIIDAPKAKVVKHSRKTGLILVVSGIVVIIATFLVGAFYNLPSLVVGVLELAGFALFIKGFMMVKD